MLLFPMARKKKLIWIDADGNVVHATKSRAKLHVAWYEGGVDEKAVAAVEVGGKWGFSRPGAMVVEPAWDMAGRFCEGRGSVARYFGPGYRQGSVFRWGYVDDSGAVAIEPAFTAAAPFVDGAAFVQVPDESDLQSIYSPRCWGVIDREGELVVPPQFDMVHALGSAFARFCVDGKWGHLDQRGQILVEAQYDAVGQFSDGVARVIKGGASRTPAPVDERGMLVISPSFDGLMGLVDTSGREVVPCSIPAPSDNASDEDSDFSDGLARFQADDRFGYWNTAGEIVVEARFADCHRFSEQLGLPAAGRRIDLRRRVVAGQDRSAVGGGSVGQWTVDIDAGDRAVVAAVEAIAPAARARAHTVNNPETRGSFCPDR